MDDIEIFKNEASHLSTIGNFLHVKYIKQNLTIDDICNAPHTKGLKPFFSEIFGLTYKEKPNYNKLKLILVSILLDSNILPQMNLTGINEINEKQPNDDLFYGHDHLEVADEKLKEEV